MAAAAAAAALGLGATACAAGVPDTSKSLSQEPTTEESATDGSSTEESAAVELKAEVLTQEVPADIAEQQLGWPWDIAEQHPAMLVGIVSEVPLERYAYTTEKGNKACEGDHDRPAFTIDPGQKDWFCLEPGGGKDQSANAVINVTYKIVGDPEGRTVWMYAIAPQVGYNRVLCDVRKADMDTVDKQAPYECQVSFGGDRHSYFPGPRFELKKK